MGDKLPFLRPINLFSTTAESIRRRLRLLSLLLFAVIITETLPAQDQAADNAISSIRQRINTSTKKLGYSYATAAKMISLGISLENRGSEPLLADMKNRLTRYRQQYEHKNISISRLCEIESQTTVLLRDSLTMHIKEDENMFDLRDVAVYKKTQCLGFTQLYYIFGNAIGLDVTAINVIQQYNAVSSAAGFGHIACMVKLSNDKMIMVDPIPHGFVSEPFYLDNTFKQTGYYLELIDGTNSLKTHRKIQLLNLAGLKASIYNNQAKRYSSFGQTSIAAIYYRKAIELFPHLAEAHNNLGVCHLKSGDYGQALMCINRSLSINPDYAEAYNNRGIAYRKTGRLYRAIADYEKALSLNPEFSQADHNRKIALKNFR